MRATKAGSSTTMRRVVRVLRAEGAVRVSRRMRSTVSRGTARSENFRMLQRFSINSLNSICFVFSVSLLQK